jgi:hypothetical protein
VADLPVYSVTCGSLSWTAQLSDDDVRRWRDAGAVVEPVGAVEDAPAVRRPARKSK